jgi:hypothetical protein
MIQNLYRDEKRVNNYLVLVRHGIIWKCTRTYQVDQSKTNSHTGQVRSIFSNYPPMLMSLHGYIDYLWSLIKS